jgi:hypothetical protein
MAGFTRLRNELPHRPFLHRRPRGHRSKLLKPENRLCSCTVPRRFGVRPRCIDPRLGAAVPDRTDGRPRRSKTRFPTLNKEEYGEVESISVLTLFERVDDQQNRGGGTGRTSPKGISAGCFFPGGHRAGLGPSSIPGRNLPEGGPSARR